MAILLYTSLILSNISRHSVFVFFMYVWVQHHLLNYLDTFIKSQSLCPCNSTYRLLKEPPSASLNCSCCLFISARQRGSAWGCPPCSKAQICLTAENRAWRLCLPSLQGPVWCCLLSRYESSCLTCFVLFPSFSQWKDKLHVPPGWKQKSLFLCVSFCCCVFKFSVIFLGSANLLSQCDCHFIYYSFHLVHIL